MWKGAAMTTSRAGTSAASRLFARGINRRVADRWRLFRRGLGLLGASRRMGLRFSARGGVAANIDVFEFEVSILKISTNSEFGASIMRAPRGIARC